MFHEPAPVHRGVLEPPSTHRTHHRRVILGDVVEVVGHGPPYILLRVVSQDLQQLQHRRGVGLEHPQTTSPRQPRPRALRDQAPHVLVGVYKPTLHRLQRALRVLAEEGADGELTRPQPGHLSQRLHPAVKTRHAVIADEVDQGPAGPPLDLAAALKLAERGPPHDLHGSGWVLRQQRTQAGDQMSNAVLELQLQQSARPVGFEPGHVKLTVGALNLDRDRPHHLEVDIVFERCGVLGHVSSRIARAAA
jgi:hypothetical protein